MAEERTGTEPSIEERSGDATLASQSSIAFVGNVLKKVLGFGIIAVITRLVSPSIYGLFVLGTSIIFILQVVASLGVHRAVDYYVPQYLADGDQERARGVLIQAAIIGLGSSLAVAGLLVLTAGPLSRQFGDASLEIVLLLLAAALPLLAIYNVLLAMFSGIKDLRYRVYVRDLVRPIVRLLATLALLLAGSGLLALVGGYVIGLIVGILVGVALLVRNTTWLWDVESRYTPWSTILRYSVPLSIAGIIYVVLGQIDYFVIGVFLTANEVGTYRVGYLLAANMVIFFTAVAPIFKPLIAEVREDTDLVKRRYRTATRWITLFSLPLAIVVGVGAQAYLALVFTPQYTVATLPVIVLTVGYLLNVSMGGPDGTLLQGLGYSRLVFANSVLLIGINLVGSVLLVPPLGMLGAALSTAGALTAVGVATILELYLIRGIHPFTRSLAVVWAAAIPAMVAGIVLWELSPDLRLFAVALPVVVLLVYVPLVFFGGGITENDLDVLAEVSPRVARRVARFV